MFDRRTPPAVTPEVDELFSDGEDLEFNSYQGRGQGTMHQQTPPIKQPVRSNPTPTKTQAPTTPAAQTPSKTQQAPKAKSNPTSSDAEALPGAAVGLIPPASAFGFLMLSILLKTLAGSAAASVAGPLILLGSPYVTPWVGMSVIAICHKQGWIRARTISISILLGWSAALPFAPIFLIPVANSIPTVESLRNQTGSNFAPTRPLSPNPPINRTP